MDARSRRICVFLAQQKSLLTKSAAAKLSLIVMLAAGLPLSLLAQTFSSLATFNESNGANPYGALVQGANGNFYGTTQFGGAHGQGEVFEVTSGGEVTVLHSFCSNFPTCSDGYQPFAGLTRGSDNNFFGTTVSTVFSMNASGTLTTLTNSVGSQHPLVKGPDGGFYDTTSAGGERTVVCQSYCGSIFKVTSGGAVTTIHNFKGIDGYDPQGLLLGKDGNFYGTALSGGAHGEGVIFKVSPSGTYTLLHSFNGTDGFQPSLLIQGSNGDFYGTTASTVFEITPSGKLTTVYSFSSSGIYGPDYLLQATNGNLYGTACCGGNTDESICFSKGCGGIFELTASGELTTLYEFCPESGCSDGASPSSLIQGSNGDLYGATLLGGSTVCGADGSCGTVFSQSLGEKQ